MPWVLVEQSATKPLKVGDRITVKPGEQGVSWGSILSPAGERLRVVGPPPVPAGYAAHGNTGSIAKLQATTLHFGDAPAVVGAQVDF